VPLGTTGLRHWGGPESRVRGGSDCGHGHDGARGARTSERCSLGSCSGGSRTIATGSGAGVPVLVVTAAILAITVAVVAHVAHYGFPVY